MRTKRRRLRRLLAAATSVVVPALGLATPAAASGPGQSVASPSPPGAASPATPGTLQFISDHISIEAHAFDGSGTTTGHLSKRRDDVRSFSDAVSFTDDSPTDEVRTGTALARQTTTVNDAAQLTTVDTSGVIDGTYDDGDPADAKPPSAFGDSEFRMTFTVDGGTATFFVTGQVATTAHLAGSQCTEVVVTAPDGTSTTAVAPGCGTPPTADLHMHGTLQPGQYTFSVSAAGGASQTVSGHGHGRAGFHVRLVLGACDIVGTPADEEIDGTEDGETICGMGGNDTIHGLGGNDVIFGGEQQDTIDGGSGADTIHGLGGNDVIKGGIGDDEIFGDAGCDTVDGGADSDDISGGDEPPSSELCDKLDGDSGDDQIFGDGGSNLMLGNAGNDTIVGGPNSDVILDTQGPNDRLDGGPGRDGICGSPEDDTITGGPGDDLLTGNHGRDSVSGGDGNDVISGGDGSFGIAGQNLCPADTDAADVGDVLDGGPGDDQLSGDDGRDHMIGGRGSDKLEGAFGEDTLVGGPGKDVLNGGPSNDSIDACDGVLDTVIGGDGSNDRARIDHGVDDVLADVEVRTKC